MTLSLPPEIASELRARAKHSPDPIRRSIYRFVVAADLSVWERNHVDPDYVPARDALLDLEGETPESYDDRALRVVPKELEGPFWSDLRKRLAMEMFRVAIRSRAEALGMIREQKEASSDGEAPKVQDRVGQHHGPDGEDRLPDPSGEPERGGDEPDDPRRLQGAGARPEQGVGSSLPERVGSPSDGSGRLDRRGGGPVRSTVVGSWYARFERMNEGYGWLAASYTSAYPGPWRYTSDPDQACPFATAEEAFVAIATFERTDQASADRGYGRWRPVLDKDESPLLAGQVRRSRDGLSRIRVFHCYGFGSGGRLYMVSVVDDLDVPSPIGIDETELARLFPDVVELRSEALAPCSTCGRTVDPPLPALVEARRRAGLPTDRPARRCSDCVLASLIRLADAPDDDGPTSNPPERTER